MFSSSGTRSLIVIIVHMREVRSRKIYSEVTALMHTTLDNVALLKNKLIGQKKLAPWFN